MTDYKAIKLIKNGVEYCFPSGSIADLYRFKYIIVGGGGGGGTCGGGGGGDVCFGEYYTIDKSVCIIVGAGGAARCNGGNSYMGPILARGGYSQSGTSNYGCDSGNLNYGAIGATYYAGGGTGAGGDGASGAGCRGGNGGLGLCGYGGGGGGWGYKTRGYGCCGGGNGGACANPGSNATTCGSGGGGHCACTGVGTGAAGIGIICYKTDGEDGINCATGGTVTTSGDYTVHTFTSNGTFTIVS